MTAFDKAWEVVKAVDPYDATGEEVQKLHQYLSMATSSADELGLHDIESMVVQAQALLESEYPGSEAEYYGN